MNLQVNVKDYDTGEASMNKLNYIAFLYFPKNYTENLIEYINNRENYDNMSRSFAHLTKDSEFHSILLQ